MWVGAIIFLHWFFFFCTCERQGMYPQHQKQNKSTRWLKKKRVLNPLNQTAQFPLLKLISCQPAFAVQSSFFAVHKTLQLRPCLSLVDTSLGGRTFGFSIYAFFDRFIEITLFSFSQSPTGHCPRSPLSSPPPHIIFTPVQTKICVITENKTKQTLPRTGWPLLALASFQDSISRTMPWPRPERLGVLTEEAHLARFGCRTKLGQQQVEARNGVELSYKSSRVR